LSTELERREETRKKLSEGKTNISYEGPAPDVFLGGAVGGGLGALLGFLFGGRIGAVIGALLALVSADV
jgi:hypothetical protein